MNALPEIKTWKYTKWLVATSLGFMIPAIYGYINQAHFLSGVLGITSLVSANYWRNAITGSIRYKTDLIVAKIAYGIFLMNGHVCIRYIPYMITFYISIIITGYCYYMSGKLLSMNDLNWYKYHIAFHLWLIYSQWIIIDSAIYRNITQN
jgi:hypothetical protein